MTANRPAARGLRRDRVVAEVAARAECPGTRQRGPRIRNWQIERWAEFAPAYNVDPAISSKFGKFRASSSQVIAPMNQASRWVYPIGVGCKLASRPQLPEHRTHVKTPPPPTGHRRDHPKTKIRQEDYGQEDDFRDRMSQSSCQRTFFASFVSRFVEIDNRQEIPGALPTRNQTATKTADDADDTDVPMSSDDGAPRLCYPRVSASSAVLSFPFPAPRDSKFAREERKLAVSSTKDTTK